jgi:hypothetical protein
MDWRDISGAPKDGTEILIFMPRTSSHRRSRDLIRVARWAYHRDASYGYWKMDREGSPSATHWQPLPPPPA